METKTRYLVRDRNDNGRILAGPFDTDDDARAECELWRGVTDPHVTEDRLTFRTFPGSAVDPSDYRY